MCLSNINEPGIVTHNSSLMNLCFQITCSMCTTLAVTVRFIGYVIYIANIVIFMKKPLSYYTIAGTFKYLFYNIYYISLNTSKPIIIIKQNKICLVKSFKIWLFERHTCESNPVHGWSITAMFTLQIVYVYLEPEFRFKRE